jgi:hypothetical protein
MQSYVRRGCCSAWLNPFVPALRVKPYQALVEASAIFTMCSVIDNFPGFSLRSASLGLAEALHRLPLYAKFQQLAA